jgi:uncharacterized protein (TIGR02246 family)
MFVVDRMHQAPADTHDADVKAIRDMEAACIKDIAAKDPAKWANYYSDDAILMTRGRKVMKGKAAITEGPKALTSDPNLSLQFNPVNVEVAKSGDIAAVQGTYTITMTDPVSKNTMNDAGSYITVYKKQADGAWKALYDGSISEVPPPAPAASEKK